MDTQKFQVLIIDLGSQYTLVIGRLLREIGYRSITLPPQKAEAWLNENDPKAIILSGGSGSVTEENCPKPPEQVFTRNIPVLGICLGMQWIAQHFGGTVSTDVLLHKEYGRVFLRIEEGVLFQGIEDKRTLVWASHGDCVAVVPDGFKVLAHSEDHLAIAAIANEDETIVGVQFHPEVKDSLDGKRMFENFLTKAECVIDWHPSDVVQEIRREVLEAISGTNGKAIIGFSGGVDSTVLTAVLLPVFGDKLLCVTIDTGFLRKGEVQEIEERAKLIGANHIVIDAAPFFFDAVHGVTDPETKRKLFKEQYQKIFELHAKHHGAAFIIQGSLATDFIESGKEGGSELIKSHHNVGIEWNLQEMHPFRNFFKYEVREIGKSVGLPESITERMPFPGPGLLIRVIGTPVTREIISILRECDAMVREILEKKGIYTEISQLVVALDGSKTVGVKGDSRCYGYSIIIRPVVTHDFMTATTYRLPWDVVDELINTVTKHPDVTRVFFDFTQKPPATTEME